MKIIKRILILTALLIVAAILFRGAIYRTVVGYRATGERTLYMATNKQLIQYIDENDKENSNIEDIVKLSLWITSQKLTFSTEKTERDPNKLIHTKKANCIGYSLFYSAVCNYLLEKHSLSDWQARPQIGQIYAFGVNLHSWLQHPFLQDHDFVLIKNKKTHEKIAVDPSVYDYLRINFVTLKENRK